MELTVHFEVKCTANTYIAFYYHIHICITFQLTRMGPPTVRFHAEQ